MPNRRKRLPDGIEQLCLFPGDVAIQPRRSSGSRSRSDCQETGHTWVHGQQMRLFGLPPDDLVYCSTCGMIFR
jgi:hypothetical protein